MRLVIVTTAVVLIASAAGADRVVPSPLEAEAADRGPRRGTRAGVQDRVAGVLAEARRALGGEQKLASVKAISAEGPFRRVMGPREMEGTIALLIVTPDKFRRSEEMMMGGMVGGPTVERITTFNGTDAWDDVRNNAAVGGGFRMEIRDGPGPGGPGGPPGARGPLTEEQMNEARVRRAKTELQRWMVALLADPSQTWTDAGVAESPDGKADMLETKDPADRAVRVFIDQATHMPLLVQYQEIRPQVMIQDGPRGGRGGPGPGGAPPAAGAPGQPGGAAQPSPEEIERRIEEMRRNPPKPSTFAMHLADYKKVDGVMLPHKISISIDGQPNEEWTVEKYRINPSVKASDFEKPKK
jgi:hypothetical protein